MADVLSFMYAHGVMCDVRDARQDQARWLAQSLGAYRRNKLLSGPCGSGRWSVDSTEDGRMFAVGSETYINMEWNKWCFQENMIEERTC